jgi:hypothetical protein
MGWGDLRPNRAPIEPAMWLLHQSRALAEFALPFVANSSFRTASQFEPGRSWNALIAAYGASHARTTWQFVERCAARELSR